MYDIQGAQLSGTVPQEVAARERTGERLIPWKNSCNESLVLVAHLSCVSHKEGAIHRARGGRGVRVPPALVLGHHPITRLAAHLGSGMVINRLSVLASGFGVGFGLIHTTLVVVSGYFGIFQDVSG